MTQGDVAEIVAIVLAALLAMPCIALVYGVFAPGFARKAELRVTRNPIATFFAGLVATALVALLVVLMGSGPAPAKFLAVVVGLAGFCVALSGMSGIAARIGNATPSPFDRDRPWRAIVRGTVILELACLFPGVGWLFIYPVAIVTGMGAAALALFPSGAAQAVPQFAPPAPPVAGSPVAAQPAFAMAGPEQVMHQ